MGCAMSARTVKYALEGRLEKDRRKAEECLSPRENDWWYFVGFVAADGCLSLLPSGTLRVHVLSTDRQIIEDMKSSLAIPVAIREIPPKKSSWKVVYAMAYANKEFSRRLTDVGLMPGKSTKMGPLSVPEEWMPDFLRGYCDGDGHISVGVKGAQVSFVGGSEPFMLWVQNVLRKYGEFTIKEYKRTDRKGRWWTVYASSAAAVPFLKSVYGREGLVLERKMELARRVIC